MTRAAFRLTVTGLAAVLSLAGAAAAQGDAARDLTYRHTSSGPGLLEGSDGRPYWVLLSECAGFYGAIANSREEAGDSAGFEDYRRRGVDSYRLAVARLRQDRGVSAQEAAAEAAPRVEQAREVAQAYLARDPSMGPGTTPVTILRSTCLDLQEVYGQTAR